MYIKALTAFCSKMFSYKSGTLVISSAGLAAVIDFITHGQFMGVSIMFLLLISTLYIVDFLTGVAASRFEGDKVRSSKISYTFIKFVVLFIWIWISYQIQLMIGDASWMEFLISAISTFPLVLITLREFVSIGENIERRHGDRPYIFRLVEKVFDIVEAVFLRRIDSNNTDKRE